MDEATFPLPSPQLPPGSSTYTCRGGLKDRSLLPYPAQRSEVGWWKQEVAIEVVANKV